MFRTLRTTPELVQLTKKIIPPLLPEFHKGQAGRIVVIGGCEDYTGAPFFSAHAAALLGCDLSHVICESSAAPIIKSYSPDLMVHPYLKDSSKLDKNDKLNDEYIKENIMPKINSLLNRIQVVVVGPGFGRDELMLSTLKIIIEEVKSRNLPLIMDADSLYLISQDPNLIKGYSNALITPNVVEFKRICNSMSIDSTDNNVKEMAIKVSKELGNITVIAKGSIDYIINGDQLIEVNIKGSNKRVGGQGDSLTGMIATFLAWGTSAYKNQIWEDSKLNKPILQNDEIFMIASFGGCYLTKKSAEKAFNEYGRSMQTSDLHKFIGKSYEEHFGI